MLRPPCVAIFDVGKTNVKWVFFSLEGKQLHTLRRSNHIDHQSIYPACPVEDIWNWLQQSLATYTQDFDIKTIVVNTHGATAALLDSQGDLVFPVMDYEFSGVDECSEAYVQVKPDFQETYSPALPAGLNLGKQLFWLQQQFPGTFRQVHQILCYPQYWAWRLSGVSVSEVTSLGCHTDLWAPQSHNFSSLVCSQSWGPLFPPVVPAGETIGPLRKELREHLGISSQCQILAGLHDSNASYFRHRKHRTEAFSVVSTGTWIIAMASDQSLDTLDPTQDTLANVDVWSNPVACSRFMGGREFETIAGTEHLQDTLVVNDLVHLIESSVFALPTFAQGGGPFPGKPGNILGNLKGTSPKALAVLYCALMTDYCLHLIHAEGDLILEGSFTANPLYCQILATLRPHQTVYLSEDQTGTAKGAFVLTEWGNTTSVALTPISPLEIKESLQTYKQKWHEMI